VKGFSLRLERLQITENISKRVQETQAMQTFILHFRSLRKILSEAMRRLQFHMDFCFFLQTSAPSRSIYIYIQLYTNIEQFNYVYQGYTHLCCGMPKAKTTQGNKHDMKDPSLCVCEWVLSCHESPFSDVSYKKNSGGSICLKDFLDGVLVLRNKRSWGTMNPIVSAPHILISTMGFETLRLHETARCISFHKWLRPRLWQGAPQVGGLGRV